MRLLFSLRKDSIDWHFFNLLKGMGVSVDVFGFVGKGFSFPAYGGRYWRGVNLLSWEEVREIIDAGIKFGVPVQDMYWTGWKERLKRTLDGLDKHLDLSRLFFIVALPEAVKFLKSLGLEAELSCVSYVFFIRELMSYLKNLPEDTLVTLPPCWSFREKDFERLQKSGISERCIVFSSANCMATCRHPRCHHLFMGFIDFWDKDVADSFFGIYKGICIKNILFQGERKKYLEVLNKPRFFGIKKFYKFGVKVFKFPENWGLFKEKIMQEVTEIVGVVYSG